MIELHLFDTLLEPVFVLNKNKEILYCNETAATLAGSTPRKLTRGGKKLLEVFNFQVDTGIFNLEEITDPTPYKELRFTNSSGQNGIVQITLQRLPSTAEEQWLVFVRDVTLEEQLQNKYRAQLEQKEGVILELKAAQNELQNYSKNLENIVSQRTRQISELNQTMMALLNSLKQGFFIFNEHGDCLPVYSKACESILEATPVNKKVWEVLKIPSDKVEGLKRWLTTLFSEMLPFEDLTPLGPSSYPHSLHKTVQLEYFPIRDQNKISSVVVMASDVTDLIEAQKQAETEKSRVRLILQIVQNKKHMPAFIKELESWFSVIEKQCLAKDDDIDTELVQRALHTIKGNASLYSIQEIVTIAHHCEEQIAKAPIATQRNFLRSSLDQMKAGFANFLTQAEEILGRRTESSENKIEISERDFRNVCDILSFWSKGRILSQQMSEKYLHIHLHEMFVPFNQVVQQTAVQLNKRVRPLEIKGENVALKNLDLSALFSTLVHCFRNSIDHGLESPEQRLASGKPQEGLIQITSRIIVKNQSDYLFFQIQDDGAGIDPKKIRHKLSLNHFDSSQLSDEQVIQCIFNPSFSTKNEVTEISGRGVGLDAVKSAVLDLKGEVHVKSILGQGTIFEFYLPLDPNADNEKNFQKSAA